MSFSKKFALIASWVLVCLGTFFLGDTPWDTVWSGMLQRLAGHSTEWNPLLDERLPRLIVTLSTGASLAVAGAVMQSLFQNPLASPMVLGVTSGGSLFVILAFLLGWHLSYPFSIPIAAITGCLTALVTVFWISHRQGAMSLYHLVLTGIALSTVLLAFQGTILYAFRDRWELIQTFTEWEAGSTSDRNWSHVHLQLPLTLVGLLGCLHYREELNLMTLGDEEATNLGVEVAKVRCHLFLCVSVLTGGALAAMGIVAFFGLVLPHLLRRLIGPDNRLILPLCIAIGSPILAALDLLLRVFKIHELSIGSVSAVVGGIFFLTLLFRMQRHHHPAGAPC